MYERKIYNTTEICFPTELENKLMLTSVYLTSCFLVLTLKNTEMPFEQIFMFI